MTFIRNGNWHTFNNFLQTICLHYQETFCSPIQSLHTNCWRIKQHALYCVRRQRSPWWFMHRQWRTASAATAGVPERGRRAGDGPVHPEITPVTPLDLNTTHCKQDFCTSDVSVMSKIKDNSDTTFQFIVDVFSAQ